MYAHGGHSSDHDVDFLIREQDIDRVAGRPGGGRLPRRAAAGGLAGQGLRRGRMVDLIYRPGRAPVTDETLADMVDRPVDAIHMPVLSATQLMIHKLLSFSPAPLRLRPRRCRWPGRCASRSTGRGYAGRRQHSPYAEAFLVLLDRWTWCRTPHRRARRRCEAIAMTPTRRYVEAEIQRLLTEHAGVAEQGITVVRREDAVVLVRRGGEPPPPRRDRAAWSPSVPGRARSPATSGDPPGAQDAEELS